ncbi:MAG: sorbosone dehydrogenase family protein [Halobacteriaceae archaeon]
MPRRAPTRRALLAATAAGLAGCGLPRDDGRPTTDGDGPTTHGGGTTGGGGTTTAGVGTATGDRTATGDGTTTTSVDPNLTPNQPPPDAVGLEPVATGLDAPVDVVWPAPDRRYVAEQAGVVRVHRRNGFGGSPLLDLRDAVVAGGERGLLGIALHPEFDENRRLFVRYSAPRRTGTPASYSHTFVLAEFAVGADGRSVVAGSERTVLEIPEPQANHNAGSIVFGADGFLYVGVGDGGAGADKGDGHVEDWYDSAPGGNGQDVVENLLGSVLRLDVDASDRGGGRNADGSIGDGTDGVRGGYGVPDDNPLVGRTGRDEHYAWGFRNPWRLAVDGADLYAGDVGQNRYEEVDLVESGGNYGWNVLEGTHCFRSDTCPAATPPSVRGGEPLRDPVIEYSHSGTQLRGISVIAGNIYRGDALPGLRGRYVFGDYSARGNLFVATPADEGLWETRYLSVADGGDSLTQLRSIARHDGEIHVLSGGRRAGLYRVVPA